MEQGWEIGREGASRGRERRNPAEKKRRGRERGKRRRGREKRRGRARSDNRKEREGRARRVCDRGRGSWLRKEREVNKGRKGRRVEHTMEGETGWVGEVVARGGEHGGVRRQENPEWEEDHGRRASEEEGVMRKIKKRRGAGKSKEVGAGRWRKEAQHGAGVQSMD